MGRGSDLSTAADGIGSVEQGNALAAPRVEIYVADHCMVCEYAYEVADAIRHDFPQVDLQIVNLSHSTTVIPESVFATPTYLLDGRLWSLGNPSPADVHSRLSEALTRHGITQ